MNANKITQLTAKIEQLKAYREELNDTNEDTLSIDQLIHELERQIKSINMMLESEGVSK